MGRIISQIQLPLAPCCDLRRDGVHVRRSADAVASALEANRLNMPTIEVFAIGQREPIQFVTNAFALVVDQTIVSHRSLFQEKLVGMRGSTYHLGNKECETQGYFFGSQLFTERSFYDEENPYLEFRANVKSALMELMNTINCASDLESLLFLTDYQFGPTDAIHEAFPSIEAFWRAHDTGLLRINGMYTIAKSG